MGVLLNDWTFFLTAYTGTAAMSIGGFTIRKSAFLNTERVLTKNDKSKWRDMSMMVVDEVSFLNDNEFQTLQQLLQQMGDRTKPFGGYFIVFSGNFHQL